jgi:hypothetical protein
MTEPIRARRRPLPLTEADIQARAERRAERMVLAAIARIENKTGIARYRIAATFMRLIASERE